MTTFISSVCLIGRFFQRLLQVRPVERTPKANFQGLSKQNVFQAGCPSCCLWTSNVKAPKTVHLQLPLLLKSTNVYVTCRHVWVPSFYHKGPCKIHPWSRKYYVGLTMNRPGCSCFSCVVTAGSLAAAATAAAATVGCAARVGSGWAARLQHKQKTTHHIHGITPNCRCTQSVFIMNAWSSSANKYDVVFIVHQHADYTTVYHSVWLSVYPMPMLCLNEWTYHHTFLIVQ